MFFLQSLMNWYPKNVSCGSQQLVPLQRSLEGLLVENWPLVPEFPLGSSAAVHVRCGMVSWSSGLFLTTCERNISIFHLLPFILIREYVKNMSEISGLVPLSIFSLGTAAKFRGTFCDWSCVRTAEEKHLQWISNPNHEANNYMMSRWIQIQTTKFTAWFIKSNDCSSRPGVGCEWWRIAENQKSLVCCLPGTSLGAKVLPLGPLYWKMLVFNARKNHQFKKKKKHRSVRPKIRWIANYSWKNTDLQ